MSDSQSSDEDWTPDGRPPKRQKRSGGPFYQAVVISTPQLRSASPSPATESHGDDIMTRITEQLVRDVRTNPSQEDLKTAICCASNMLREHNLDRCLVLKHVVQGPVARRRQLLKRVAGESMVSIQRGNGDRKRRVIIEDYIGELAKAFSLTFDCRSKVKLPKPLEPGQKRYKSLRAGGVTVSFFGMTESTILAASAFSMLVNQMSSSMESSVKTDRLGRWTFLVKQIERQAADEKGKLTCLARKMELADERERRARRASELQKTMQAEQLRSQAEMEHLQTATIIELDEDGSVVMPYEVCARLTEHAPEPRAKWRGTAEIQLLKRAVRFISEEYEAIFGLFKDGSSDGDPEE